jgi:hypothetical protein
MSSILVRAYVKFPSRAQVHQDKSREVPVSLIKHQVGNAAEVRLASFQEVDQPDVQVHSSDKKRVNGY